MAIEDFYDEQTYDFYAIKGDTIFLKLEFYDTNDNPINMGSFDIKWTLQHPITDEPILSLQKDRTTGTPNGIYTVDDTAFIFGTGITESNQIVVHLTPDESKLLDQEVYLFDLEFEMVYIVDYTDKGEKYMVRSKISGNEQND